MRGSSLVQAQHKGMSAWRSDFSNKSFDAVSVPWWDWNWQGMSLVAGVSRTLNTEGSAIVTSDLYGQLIACGRSAASEVARVAASPISVEAAKRLHPLFAMTGTDTNVWPLSPQDWSTG
jgi:hypothetical protein